MESIDEIIDRIKSRNSLIANEKNLKPKKEQHYGIKCSLVLLSLFSLILSILIYAKKDENGNFLKENFDINVNFSEINDNIEVFIKKFFVFEYNFHKKNNDKYVGLSDSYIGLGNNQYTNSSYKVYAIANGLVTNVEYTSIKIEHDNGIVAIYSNVIEPLVYTYDRVKEYQIIANMNENIEMLFYQNGKIINYEEIYS